ncbi:MAG: nucleotidyltransferase domain-containing protein [Phycisphaeraceae bacterium]
MSNIQIPIDHQSVQAFCRKWRVREFSLFGSVLRKDFHDGSDVDVLVSFEENAPWSLWELIEMRDELATLFNRPVDLIEKEAIENPFRRHRILSTCEVIVAA